jgi:hypothetical protein
MFWEVGRGGTCSSVAHPFILQFYASSFGMTGREKWCTAFLNTAGHKEVSHGLGVQDVSEFDSD